MCFRGRSNAFGRGESVPIAMGQIPAANSAAQPEDEPPVWCALLYGLRGVPIMHGDRTSVLKFNLLILKAIICGSALKLVICSQNMYTVKW